MGLVIISAKGFAICDQNKSILVRNRDEKKLLTSINAMYMLKSNNHVTL